MNLINIIRILRETGRYEEETIKDFEESFKKYPNANILRLRPNGIDLIESADHAKTIKELSRYKHPDTGVVYPILPEDFLPIKF